VSLALFQSDLKLISDLNLGLKLDLNRGLSNCRLVYVIVAQQKAISNQSILHEVRDRDTAIAQLHRNKRKQTKGTQPCPAPPQPCATATSETHPDQSASQPDSLDSSPIEATPAGTSAAIAPTVIEPVKPKKPVPFVRVYESYEHLKRESQQS
jgi:putative transposase